MCAGGLLFLLYRTTADFIEFTMLFSELQIGDEFRIQSIIPPVVTFAETYRKISAFEYARTDRRRVVLALADIPVLRHREALPRSPNDVVNGASPQQESRNKSGRRGPAAKREPSPARAFPGGRGARQGPAFFIVPLNASGKLQPTHNHKGFRNMFQAKAKRRRRFDSRFNRGNAKHDQRSYSRRLGLESLEPRQMLAAYSVGLVSQAAVFSASAGSSSTFGGAISQDGRYVAFQSDSRNLVSGMEASPNFGNVYRFDRQTGEVALVSVNDAGTGGANGVSENPSISADGSIVTFESRGSNLSPLATTNSMEVFARNMSTGLTYLVSVNSGGTAAGNGDSFNSVISADGKVVAFASYASDLSPIDTNSSEDVYARNLAAGTTNLVSVNNAGVAGGNAASGVLDQGSPDGTFTPLGIRRIAISAHGDVVAFTSEASDLTAISDVNGVSDVFARNLTTHLTSLISVNSGGGASGNDQSFNPVVSADGTIVAFESAASNLTTLPDTNHVDDVFARNLTTGVTSLVSVNSSGTAAANGWSEIPVINADGTVVAFHSGSTNLTPSGSSGVFVRNITTGTAVLVGLFGTGPSISADGNVVAFQANIGQGSNVYATNVSTNTTSLVSATPTGAAGDNDSVNPIVSADGSVVAFQSEANDLAANAFGGADRSLRPATFVRQHRPGFKSGRILQHCRGPFWSPDDLGRPSHFRRIHQPRWSIRRLCLRCAEPGSGIAVWIKSATAYRRRGALCDQCLPMGPPHWRDGVGQH